MTPPRFGTDGVRGVANEELTAELALALGRAVARVLPAAAFVVGRDTRRSGPMLFSAFAAGICTEGADVIDVGVLPTPAIAYLAERRGLPGAVISASHNPFADNGIKVLGTGGTKLSVEVEAEIEAALEAVLAQPDAAPRRPTGFSIGTITTDASSVADYEAHLAEALEGRDLRGLKVALDCANGAASVVGPAVFSTLGCTLLTMATSPDGSNINDQVGSTAPGRLAELVLAEGCDLGLCLDGDADRLIAIDHHGQVVDGDQVMATFAKDLKARGRLAGNTVVVTVMSNLGFHRAMADADISVIDVAVGDRNVLAALDAEGLSFGGEQSGHLIFRQRASTGDGLLTGILLCDLVARSGQDLASLADAAMERLPQVLLNVKVDSPEVLVEHDSVLQAIEQHRAVLEGTGRILVRASGTEPLIRVMVEATDHAVASTTAEQLSELIRTLDQLALEARAAELEDPGPTSEQG